MSPSLHRPVSRIRTSPIKIGLYCGLLLSNPVWHDIQPEWIDKEDRITPHIFIQSHSIDIFKRVARHEPAQHRMEHARPIVDEVRLLIMEQSLMPNLIDPEA